jgi:bacteriorhodopsin
MTENNVDVKAHLRKFILYYICLNVLIIAVSFFIDVPSSVGAIVYFISMYAALEGFVKEKRGALDQQEKAKFVRGFFKVYVVLMVAVLLMLYVAGSLSGEGDDVVAAMSDPAFYIIVVVFSAFIYGCTYLAVKFFPKAMVKRLEQDGDS